jgi:hypothetical protein
MASNNIKKFLAEVDKLARGRGNQRSAMFARRAYQAVVEVYEIRNGEYEPRPGCDTAHADRLIEMGTTEAVYGRGRALLYK